jgi:hypothetical protein
MIIFNLKKAEALLKSGAYSNRFVLTYFLIYIIFSMILLYVDVEPLKGWKLVLDISASVISLLGLFFVFSINEKGDQKNFLDRYFVLGFVVFARLMIFSIPIAIVLFIILKFVFSQEALLNNFWLEYSLTIIIILFYYWLLAQSFRLVAKD